MPRLIDLFLSAKAQEAASSNSFVVGFRNALADQPAEIALYGEIGDPYEQMDARSVGQFLRANKGRPVNVRINSPGGLAYDGITMHNALLQHDGKVTTIIEGMAGSAASIVAMAGSTVQMWENGNLFIHRASVVAIGNVDVMTEAAGWLQKIDDAIARTYKAKTGKPLDKIAELMRGKVDGTVFTAKEALSGKWIDEIVSLKPGTKASSTFAPTSLRPEADRRLNSIELAQAERIRSRRDMFQPTETFLGKTTAKMSALVKPKLAGGPTYDVGDMVRVMEDGVQVGTGEVRSSCLGYSYDVRQANGQMICDCCEDDLVLIPGGES